MSALWPQNVLGLFPEDPKRVRACTVRQLRIPFIEKRCVPIAAKQQRFHLKRLMPFNLKSRNLRIEGSFTSLLPRGPPDVGRGVRRMVP